MSTWEELRQEEGRVKKHVNFQIKCILSWGWPGDYSELRRELTQEAWLAVLIALQSKKKQSVDRAVRKQLNRWWHREQQWLRVELLAEERDVDVARL